MPARIHGMRRHPLWGVWYDMKRRCYCQDDEAYDRYGGRGIGMCYAWRTDFMAFYRWAIVRWKPGLQIDRKDNNKGYLPTNCRFVTRMVNCNNKRNHHKLTIFGETKNVSQWARDRRCAVNYGAFKMRIRMGWKPEVALTRPSRYAV